MPIQQSLHRAKVTPCRTRMPAPSPGGQLRPASWQRPALVTPVIAAVIVPAAAAVIVARLVPPVVVPGAGAQARIYDQHTESPWVAWQAMGLCGHPQPLRPYLRSAWPATWVARFVLSQNPMHSSGQQLSPLCRARGHQPGGPAVAIAAAPAPAVRAAIRTAAVPAKPQPGCCSGGCCSGAWGAQLLLQTGHAAMPWLPLPRHPCVRQAPLATHPPPP